MGGGWVPVHTALVGHEMKSTFYSGVPASYRGRVHPAGATPIDAVGVGAAWTPSPPLGIAY